MVQPVNVRDGAVDSEAYFTVSRRILWILKEVHDETQSHPEIVDSLRRFAELGWLDPHWGHTWRKVAKTSYSLLHPESDWKEWDDHQAIYVPALRFIAAINVKKTGGGRASNPHQLKAAFRENENRLRAQITELRPNVVIGGNVLHLFASWFQRRPTKPGAVFDSWVQDGVVWVNAYHPQYTTCTDRDYSDRVQSAIERSMQAP